MAGIDRIMNELDALGDEGLADVFVEVVREIGNRGRTAGEAVVAAAGPAMNDTNFEEGVAQIEPIFEE